MDTINKIELGDESVYPDETVLEKILGASYGSYLELLELFGRYEVTREWRYYHDGKAWLCKVQKKKKTLVWMSAWRGFMKATIYVPLSVLDSVLSLDLTESTKEAIREAKNVGKSKPCVFEIRDGSVLQDFETVLKWKIGMK